MKEHTLSTRTPPNYDLSLLPMSAADLQERRECEATIQNGMAVMEDMAEAATRLRDKMLYRNTHGTWEAYCAEHFGRSARRIQQICAGQGVIKEFEVMPNPPGVRPTNEKQVRPLVGLPPEARREVWDEAVSQTPAGKPVSASTVRAVADRRKPKKETTTEDAEYTERETGKDGCRTTHIDTLVLEAGKGTEPGDFVDIAMLALKHKWPRDLACIVFDALIDRGLVKGGRWVEKLKFETAESGEKPEWPRPNKHGVYDEDDARVERLEFKHALATAEVLVLQVRSGWISRCNYDHKCGNHVGNSGPLTVTLMHTTRESALTVALDDLRKKHLAVVNERGGHPKQKLVAKMIAEWCGTQLRELSPRANAASSSGTLALGEEYRGAADRKVAAIAKEIALKVGSCSSLIRDLPPVLQERFGQTIYFLECAGRELGRLAKDPDNSKAQTETAERSEVRGQRSEQKTEDDEKTVWQTVAGELCSEESRIAAIKKSDDQEWLRRVVDETDGLHYLSAVNHAARRRLYGKDASPPIAARAKDKIKRIARARWNKAKALGKKLGKGKNYLGGSEDYRYVECGQCQKEIRVP